MYLPQELINMILYKYGGLSIKEELKKEIIAGSRFHNQRVIIKFANTLGVSVKILNDAFVFV